ncbi:MAG: PaaI family thioesterase [Pirellulaceae bacterium]|jgi:acyl-coenzyme A thioesterase PaaI-like protein|nr:PaaI family thioesterase [Pirellulaceae bacterium]
MKHDPSHVARSAFRRQTHPGCFVCGPANGHGLGLEFRLGEGGVVEASFACQGAFEGYPATLHGGIICALLDGAMTNCLFAHGHAAVTAELKVRFRHPVMTERPARVRAWIASSLRPLHELAAELVQEEQVMATARGKFLEKSARGIFESRL